MNKSDQVTKYIQSFGDWRGEILQELRQVINQASPDIAEDFKWNVPVWTANGMVGAISAFSDHVKINFFKGVYLPDPQKVINSGQDAKEHRSIDFFEGDKLNKPAISQLVKEAVAYNKAN